MTEPIAVVIVCQGPPRCELTGEVAEQAARAGCPWCDRCYIGDDGTETWERVAEA